MKLNLMKINTIEVVMYKSSLYDWNLWLINGLYEVETKNLSVDEVRNKWYKGYYSKVTDIDIKEC